MRGRQQRQGTSGGAWKVAFADFMISMMAFFLVLWIVEASSLKQRKNISEGLNSQSVFDKNGGITDKLDETALALHEGEVSEIVETLGLQSEQWFETEEDIGNLAQAFSSFAKAEGFSKNIDLQSIAAGLRITIRDDDTHKMFLRGRTEITPFFYDRIFEMAQVFQYVKNSVLITGHTDANPYHSSEYSNWDLSGERALEARKVLVKGGMPESRLSHVSAYAATQLVNENDPFASDNRRVELVILTPKAEAFLQSMFKVNSQHNLSEFTTDVIPR